MLQFLLKTKLWTLSGDLHLNFASSSHWLLGCIPSKVWYSIKFTMKRNLLTFDQVYSPNNFIAKKIANWLFVKRHTWLMAVLGEYLHNPMDTGKHQQCCEGATSLDYFPGDCCQAIIFNYYNFSILPQEVGETILYS